MQFSPVLTIVVGPFSEIKNSAVVDTLRNATTASFRTDNDSHYKSSAVAEMGDGGHNRHGPKRGGCCAPFAGVGTPFSI